MIGADSCCYGYLSADRLVIKEIGPQADIHIGNVAWCLQATLQSASSPHSACLCLLLHAQTGSSMVCGCRNEAAELAGKPECTADEAARELGSHCMVGMAVTDGARGSCISALGQVTPASSPPGTWICKANEAGDNTARDDS